MENQDHQNNRREWIMAKVESLAGKDAKYIRREHKGL